MTYIIISELSITINSDGLQLAALLGPGFAVLYSFFYCDDLIFIPSMSRQFWEPHQRGG
ncbi:MAG: hypothetical protein K0S89_368 [Nitrososphaeraceae archaeon]|jgi:hypothetical protein|nr:hypothetical protein [Nitrososphaeraceae archaeon]